jgi:transposase
MSSLFLPALPGLASLHVETLVTTETSISITASVATSTALCPDCGQVSTRVHSAYARRPRDLPWGGVPVQFTLRVRRFFCDTPACARTTFVEQVAGLTQPYAQRTLALNAALHRLGLALGGKAGARLGSKLGILGSAATILRRVQSCPPDPATTPRVVGIDDWSIRKGRRYGSIIVDLERHRPIALLPEHAAVPIAEWFQAHPSVEVIARDRASIYTEALAIGAPNAQQVADRWHLTQNLGTALQEMLAKQTRALREVARQLTAQRTPPPAAPLPSSQLPILEGSGHIVGPVELRQHQFAEAKRLRAAGWSYRRIAQELQLNWRTVVKYVHAEELPRRILPQATSSLTPYLAFIQERWSSGCQQGAQLLAEVQAQGYRGSLSSIYRALKALRLGCGRQHPGGGAVERVAVRSPRQAMWLLIREEKELSDEDRAYRAALCTYDTQIAQAAALGQRFVTMIRERQVVALDLWLTDAEMSGIKELQNLAQSLRRDYDPVKAALTSIWNNGQTEGQVNRLKMIKRTMYGRAGFELLRNRVLCAA